MTLEQEPVNVQVVMAFLENMDPWAFEHLCAQSLIHNGFDGTRVTPGSGDYGVDIIASRGNERWAVQCKRYTPTRYAGNNGIQEVYTGAHYYGCTHAAVMTTTLFTDLSKAIAHSLGVYLWDRYTLYYMVQKALRDYGFG